MGAPRYNAAPQADSVAKQPARFCFEIEFLAETKCPGLTSVGGSLRFRGLRQCQRRGNSGLSEFRGQNVWVVEGRQIDDNLPALKHSPNRPFRRQKNHPPAEQ
jgi:hypothetical protein